MSDRAPGKPDGSGRIWDRLVWLVTPNPPTGEFFGSVGERAQLELTVDEMRELLSGAMFHRLHDDSGRVFTWVNDGEASGMEPGKTYFVNATVFEHNISHNVRETHIHRVGPASSIGLPQADTIPELMPVAPVTQPATAKPRASRLIYLIVGIAVALMVGVGATLFVQNRRPVLEITQIAEPAATASPAPEPTEVPVPRPAAAPSPAASPVSSPTAEPVMPQLFVTGGGNAGVSLRSAPGVAAQRVAVLRDGMPLDDRSDERQADGRLWRKVAQPGGVEGWVAAEFLTSSRPAIPAGSPEPLASPSAIVLAAVMIPTSSTSSIPPTPESPPAGMPANKPGSVRIAPVGNDCPPTHPVKALASTGAYYGLGSASYATTQPEVCLASASDAETAGFRSGGP